MSDSTDRLRRRQSPGLTAMRLRDQFERFMANPRSNGNILMNDLEAYVREVIRDELAVTKAEESDGT